MSDHKKEAKSASAAKMQRMGLKLEDGSKSFTDERGGSAFEGLNSGNAGKMPVTPSRFKRGGKVGKAVDAEGEKAHKNLGKSARTKKAGGGANMPVPVPPRRDEPNYNPYPYKMTKAQQAALYSQEHPDEDTDLGSTRIGNARGGVIGRKQAAAMAYKTKGMGMSNKMGVPKMKGMPNLAADTYIPHKKGGAAKHPDEAEDKKLMHKVLKKDAFKDRAHKMGGGPIGGKPSPMDAMLSKLNQRMDEMGYAPGSMKRGMTPGRAKAMATGSEDARIQGDQPNMLYNKRPNFTGRKDGGRAEKCWGGEAKRSKKFGGGPITSQNPMLGQIQAGLRNFFQHQHPAAGAQNPLAAGMMGGQQAPFGGQLGMLGGAQQLPFGGQLNQLGGAMGPNMGGQPPVDPRMVMQGMNQQASAQNALDQYQHQFGMGGGQQLPFGGLGSAMPGYNTGSNGHGDFGPSTMQPPANNSAPVSSYSNPAPAPNFGNAMSGMAGAMAGRATGGRVERATGGRTKGKTNVNIIISPQSGQQGPMGAGVGMGMPPMPPQMPPMPPQMPPQGMPPMPPGGAPGGAPQLPPQLMAALAAQGGAGGPPMPRKTGGRVENKMPKYQEKDFGSGSGFGRLEKRKWPTADGTE